MVFVDSRLTIQLPEFAGSLCTRGLENVPIFLECQVLCTPYSTNFAQGSSILFTRKLCLFLNPNDNDRNYRWRGPHGQTLIRSCFLTKDWWHSSRPRMPRPFRYSGQIYGEISLVCGQLQIRNCSPTVLMPIGLARQRPKRRTRKRRSLWQCLSLRLKATCQTGWAFAEKYVLKG